MRKNFRHGKYKGPIVKIRGPKFDFDEERARMREEHLLQKEADIVAPGSNPVKREIYEENYFEKKKKMNVENKFLRSSLEHNPYYMKEEDETNETDEAFGDEKSEGSVASLSKDSKISKMHETAKGFFERHNLQGTKELSKYDCWDQDLTPEEWIEKCSMYPERTHAKCPFYRNGIYVWLNVKVLDFNKQTNRYLVKEPETNMQKHVERLSLLFHDEDKNLFKDRVQQCKHYQKRAEDEMRFQSYAEKVDNKLISTLSKTWVHRILETALAHRRKSKDEDLAYCELLANKMIKTVEAEYVREMKKCFILSQMQDKKKREIFVKEKIELRKEVKVVPYLGTICELPSLPYFESNQVQLFRKMMISKPDVYSSLVEFSKKSAEKISTHMFNYHIPHNIIPMSDVQFSNLQTKFHDESNKTLRNLWRESQITTVSSVPSLNLSFNKDDFLKNQKFFEPRLRFVKRMDLFFRSNVKALAEYNLKRYIDFVKKYVMPENADQADSSIWEVSHKPLMLLTLVAKDYEGGDRKSHKPSDEDCIFFEPSEPQILHTMRHPIKQLMDTINSIHALESSIFKLNIQAEERPIFPVDENTPMFKEAFAQIDDLMERAFREPLKIISKFREKAFLLKKSANDIVKQYLDKKEGHDGEKGKRSRERKSVDDLDNYMQTVDDSIRVIQDICINEKNTIFFMLQTSDSKKTLIDKANEIRSALLNRVGKDCSQNVSTIHESFNTLSNQITDIPTDEAKYDALMQIIEHPEKGHEKIIEKLESDTDEVGKYFDLLLKYNRDSNFDRNSYFSYWLLKKYPSVVKYEAKEAKSSSIRSYEKFQAQVNDFKKELYHRIGRLENEFKEWKSMSYTEWAGKDHENGEFNNSLDKLVADKEDLNTREKHLGVEETVFENMGILLESYKPYRDMRSYGSDFVTDTSKWDVTALIKLRFSEVNNRIDALYRNIQNLMRRFESMEDAEQAVKICAQLLVNINSYRTKMPVIKSLTKDAIIKKPVYWQEIMNATGLAAKKIPQQTITLNELVNVHSIMDHSETISEICTRAEREYGLEQRFIEQIIEQLKKKQLEVKPHKDTGSYIITGVDELTQFLDEKLTLLIVMKQDSNIRPIKDAVESQERKLRTYQDLFDAWVKCQRDWIYLKPIFDSDEIAKELPDANKKFSEVDSSWIDTMSKIHKENLIFENQDYERILVTFTSNNEKLDKIQKSLNTYLGSKREEFPRFYFLSDEELLEILSRAKEPTLVTKYMNKCFEGIDSIDFSPKIEVLNMISAEKEVVEYLRPVVTSQGDRKGRVEKWLGDVESMMRETLMKSAIKCSQDTTKRTKWVFDYPGQIILAVNNIRWTAGVEEAISEGSIRHFHQQLIKDREDIVDMVKGELTPLQRTTLKALIVIDQHAIYVVEMLIQNGIDSIQDFDWISQLRYYMAEKDKNKIKVRMITSTLPYQYEYLGNTDRLVITPLTDRCYRTLMGAYQYNYGGAPEGPAGTGKTETVKDLAKAIAVQCVVFNCSDQINTVAMSKFFKGLSQCGSWCCFDEFNRIEPEVLSVIAEQVRTIQTAIKEGRNRFIFEGVECRLNLSAFTCITMNPGYAGRSELPDNLKALFRPCAMMVPDYSLISEISLFSYGYQTATNLAKKIVASLRLSSEQLSSQKHYDFGMRALKAILVAAGNLKKKSPEEIEDRLCIRALYDVNLPKFTQNDIPLFLSITQDLFRDTKPPITDYTLLKKTIVELSEDKKLIAEEVVTKKCIETYETMLVRHGLMLVGQTMSGKTSVLNLLRDSLSRLDGQDDFLKTKDFWINPKAIDSYQLYGKLDQNTKLWTDGVLPQIMRVCENEGDIPERKWIVFDGPVDAVWIENMNTVLDDNKILCLTNGQKIKVTNKMNMVFEVEDLNDASPATVSRCGMVYLEPKQLGWRPFVKAYTMYNFPEPIKSVSEYFEFNMCWMLEPVLQFVRKNCKFPFLIDNMQMVTSVLKVFDSLCLPLKSPDYKDGPKEGKEGEALVNNYCLFAVMWGVGGVIEDSRFDFNMFVRSMIGYENVKEKYKLDLDDPDWEPRGLSYNFGEANNLYEITFDTNNHNWIPWMKTISKWIPPAQDTPYNELIVPTSDMVRNSYLISTLIENGSHFLMTGPTGTAKTISALNEITSKYHTPEIGNLQVVFSGQTSANQTQLMIEGKLTRSKKFHYVPEDGKKKLVVFIDDVNMPIKEVYGAQPPIELLRMWADHGFVYDLQQRTPKFLDNVQLLCSMGPPSSGRNMVTRRFLRHFFILFTEPFDEVSLSTIFSSILDWYFLSMKGKLPTSIVGLKDQVVNSTINVYSKVISKLLPTPKKSHYIYNLRDVSRVIQGITKATLRSFSDPNDLIKLWAHECMRVFSDRLICFDDQKIFMEEILKPVMNDTFKKGWSTIVKEEPLLFADFVPTKYPDNDTSKTPYSNIYCELTNRENVEKYCAKYLQEYNEFGATREDKERLDLVLFMTAIEHLVRIVRILGTSYGHALLVGVGGSGKRSLAKLATFILHYEKYQIEVIKGYDIKKDWVDDLQELMKSCGSEDLPNSFLFVDTQIFKEEVLEDISSILNQGEVPNLFPPEEKAKRSEEINDKFPEETEFMSPNQRFEYFIKTCKKNLHLALCFSPVGELFRKRLRTFPSLINCTTIDWFLPWPNEALKSVASFLLKDEQCELEEEVRINVSDVFVQMQEKVVELSKKYLEELRKYFYVTPTSYIELVNCFKRMLTLRLKENKNNTQRYRTGLEKISNAENEVAGKQAHLETLTPQLEVSTKETDALIVKVQEESVKADAEKIICEKETEECNKISAEASEIRKDCQIELDAAEEVLAKCIKELENIQSKDIDFFKKIIMSSSTSKNALLLCQSLCLILKNEMKLDIKMIKDPQNEYKKIPDYKTPTRLVIMAEPKKMVEMLINFRDDKIENIPPESIVKLKELMSNPVNEFNRPKMKNLAEAAGVLFGWLENILVAYDKLMIVKPKRVSLAEADAKLANAQAILKEKTDNLDRIINMIDELKAQQKTAEEKKTTLKTDIARCKRQLEAAKELTEGFKEEKKTWAAKAENLEAVYPNILGECLVASGVIAYLSVFPMEYRQKSIEFWIKLIKEKEIKMSDEFVLRNVCQDELTISNWIDKFRLPNDSISIENAIIMEESRRYPLIIDPQLQATKFIQERYQSRGLKELKPNISAKDAKLVPMIISQCIQDGQPLMVQGVEENIDSMFESLFDQVIEFEMGKKKLKFMDKFFPLNDEFRFFVTTKLSNPHYPPEICAKVTLINFTVTPEGLEDQLVNTVVAIEDQKLETRKQNTLKRNFELKRKQAENEAKILDSLSNQVGNILDDEPLIATLNESKIDTNNAIKELEANEKVKKKYAESCTFYKEVGFRISHLFFCVMDMANVEPMYQFSLEWFIDLFKNVVNTGPKVKETRIKDIITAFTDSLFVKVCRSLFEKDKLLFSFLIFLKKLVCDNITTNSEIRLLLLNIVPPTTKKPNPCSDWLKDRQWNSICELCDLEQFNGLDEDFGNMSKDWQAIYENQQPQECSLPGKWSKMNPIQRLIILKILRSDKIIPAIQNEIAAGLGTNFVEFEAFSLESVLKDSRFDTPIIFILSPGSDPLTEILKLSKKPIIGASVQALSLGQGQEPAADRAIENAKANGEWVILQNCHLAPGFLSVIERTMDVAENDRYRLWLTSMPTNRFPVSILQNGIKITNEPPRGIKASLQKSYMTYDNKMLEDLKNQENLGAWKKLLFGLSFFHAIILERRKFGALGWNIPYQFSLMDMNISLSQIKTFLEGYPEIEWKALHYLISEANYGGRVTDPMDRRLIDVILKTYFTESILKDGYKFSESGIYFAPSAGNIEHYQEYIKNDLPLNDEPEVFGMHSNANITSGKNDTNELLFKILELQPKTADGGAASTDNLIKHKCGEIKSRLPKPFDIEEAEKKYPTNPEESMNTVLQQELLRFNTLLQVIVSSLGQLEKAIEGTIIMSMELEAVYNKMYVYQVPDSWHKVSYPSLKPLTSWIEDFLRRMDFMRNWLDKGMPTSFWLSGFFFTQSFLTGTMQNYARRAQKEIDTIVFEFEVMKFSKPEDVPSRPKTGSLVYGLFLEAADWDYDKCHIEESAPKVLFNSMPMIWLKPVQQLGEPVKKEGQNDYTCPVYKTSRRAGTLSTTGHSTNYVLSIDLPMAKNQSQKHWIKRGVAMLCQLDD